MKKDNKGLTLIELVVTIAIIAIFSGVVLTFIGTGANSYRNTSSNAEAQMEVQQALDQIQNIVIDVNRGVYYAAVEGDALADPDTPGVAILNDIDQGDGLSKALYVTSAVPKENGDRPNSYEYFCEIIQWNSASKEIEYGAWTWEGIEPAEPEATGKTPTDTTVVSSAEATAPEANPDQQISPQTTPEVKPTSKAQIKIEKTILAEDITGFEVDISKAANKRVVRFQLMTDKRGKTIKTLHTVNLRNQIKVDKPEIDYGTAQPVEARIWIDDRYPREMKAGTQSSDFYPKMIGNINPDTVNWVIESIDTDVKFTENSYEKTILDVPKDTKTEEIKIHVEAKTSDGKTVQSETVTIKIIAEVKPTDLVPDKESLLLAVGNEYDLNEIIKFSIQNDDGSIIPVKDYSRITWEIVESRFSDKFNLNGSTLKVESNLGNTIDESNFTLKVSYTNDNITFEKKITVILARLDFVEPYNGAEYIVEVSKPFKVVYKVGGVVRQLDTPCPIHIIKHPPGSNESYKEGEAFTKEDVGDWEIEACLAVPNGYGELNATSNFKVVFNVFMVLTYDQNPMSASKDTKKTINALVYENDRVATTEYSIKWSITNLSNITGKYSLTQEENGKCILQVEEPPSSIDYVTVQAIPTGKYSCAPVSVEIEVRSPELIVVEYDCYKGQRQLLEYKSEHASSTDEKKISWELGYRKFQEDEQYPAENSILIVDGSATPQLSIEMNQDDTYFLDYNYILIAVQLELKSNNGESKFFTYHFRIHPKKRIYNVYESESETAVDPVTYVPSNIEDILKLEAKSDGYTYIYKDHLGTMCELRLSIHSKTGIGTFSGPYEEPSTNKWFMKRGDNYYKYYNEGWYFFHNGKDDSIRPFENWGIRARCTRYYWDLDDKMHLLDSWGALLGGISNKSFWQKWN